MPKECPFCNQAQFIKGFCKRESCQLWLPEVKECAFKVIPLVLVGKDALSQNFSNKNIN